MCMFKVITGFPNYQVSNKGEIVNTKTGKFLKPQISRGYLTIQFYVSKGKPKKFRIHRLVARAFIPNPLGLLEVNHKDGNKTNNSVDNLEWVTAKENDQHAKTYLNQTKSAGKYSGQQHSKAKKFEVKKGSEIYTLYGYSELERFFNLNRSYLFKYIKQGVTVKGFEIFEVERDISEIGNLTKHLVTRLSEIEREALESFSMKTEKPMSEISRSLIINLLKEEGYLK